MQVHEIPRTSPVVVVVKNWEYENIPLVHTSCADWSEQPPRPIFGNGLRTQRDLHLEWRAQWGAIYGPDGIFTWRGAAPPFLAPSYPRHCDDEE